MQMLVMQQQQQHARGVAASQPLGAMPARPSLPLPVPGAAPPQQPAFGGVPLAALQQQQQQYPQQQLEQPLAGVPIAGVAPGGPPAAQPSAMDVDVQPALPPPPQ